MAAISEVNDTSDPKSKTFYYDDKLPPLPLPTLEQTMEKYLGSCKAVLSDDEYLHTKNVCQQFMKNEGSMLQSLLEERTKKHKNWLDKYWREEKFLKSRAKLLFSNFFGSSSFSDHYWPLKEGTQLNRAAASLRMFMEFWQLIRKQMLVPHTSKQKSLTMHQFRYVFHTCRIPRREKDELYHGFCTEDEGNSPTHIIVLCRGYMFRIEGVNPKTGEICSYGQFYRMLKHIRKVCNEKGEDGQGVPVLTSMDRDKWADTRDHMIEISSSNKKILEQIQSSLMVLALSDSSPSNYTEMSYEAMCGDGNLCWYDKSHCVIVSANGGIMLNCEHSPYDGMAIVALGEYNNQVIKQKKGVWKDSEDVVDFILPVELVFDLDQRVIDCITEENLQLKQMKEKIEFVQSSFDKFGKAALKKYSVHPAFLVQACIQLAYIQVHKKPAAVSEVTSTRQFYHGRTEICRSCTPELVAFCNAMLNYPKTNNQILVLFQNAQSKYLSLLKDCTMNQGCDRHLFGLMVTCLEQGMELPELFTDSGYTSSEGDFDFDLYSTSLGSFSTHGTFAPINEHVYGFSYRINDFKISYTISAYNFYPEISAQRISDSFQRALISLWNALKQDFE